MAGRVVSSSVSGSASGPVAAAGAVAGAASAVVGHPHDIKGQGIYAYVTLNMGEAPTEKLHKELVQWVRKEIGAIASPDLIQ